MNENINWRRILPFIPLFGIILITIYHSKYGDTGIENIIIIIIAAIFQAVTILSLGYLFII